MNKRMLIILAATFRYPCRMGGNGSRCGRRLRKQSHQQNRQAVVWRGQGGLDQKVRRHKQDCDCCSGQRLPTEQNGDL